MKRRGLLLDDFLEEQLRGLREQQSEAVDSGLALDLLFFHTTPNALGLGSRVLHRAGADCPRAA